MSELEAEVGASETVNRYGQFDHFTPPRAVVVIEDEGAVLWYAGLTWTQTDAILQVATEEQTQREGDVHIHSFMLSLPLAVFSPHFSL